ncbi:MAG TPA: RMD1 family protein [Negativicutes bacterium]
MRAEFKAVVLSNEIDLNKIALHFGINRKFKWEDSLLLQDKDLQGIVSEFTNKMVCIFHFGSMVFINLQHHEIMDVVNYVKKLEPTLNVITPFKYVDDYKLEVEPASTPVISNDYMVTDQDDDYQIEIISTILAKSVALEKSELEINYLLDEIEEVVAKLHQGKLLTVSDEQLAKLSASILGFKLNTISYIMLLDKPHITWVNEKAATLFHELSILFELADRYQIVRHKTEALMDITEVFSGLAHAKRGNRLEWAVIILIAIEICLSLVEMIWKNFQ